MKKLTLLIVLGLACGSASAFAYDTQSTYERVAYSYDTSHGLEWSIRHVNRMLEHVRWQVRHYRADWRIRRDVERVAGEVSRLNWRFRQGDYNRYRLRSEADRIHDELHDIEVRLHLRSSDYYRWG